MGLRGDLCLRGDLLRPPPQGSPHLCLLPGSVGPAGGRAAAGHCLQQQRRTRPALPCWPRGRSWGQCSGTRSCLLPPLLSAVSLGDLALGDLVSRSLTDPWPLGTSGSPRHQSWESGHSGPGAGGPAPHILHGAAAAPRALSPEGVVCAPPLRLRALLGGSPGLPATEVKPGGAPRPLLREGVSSGHLGQKWDPPCPGGRLPPGHTCSASPRAQEPLRNRPSWQGGWVFKKLPGEGPSTPPPTFGHSLRCALDCCAPTGLQAPLRSGPEAVPMSAAL